MKTTTFLIAAAALSTVALRAQNNSAPAQPSSPAPAVVQAPAGSTASSGATQVVYSPKLPTPEELTNAASAQGYTIEKIVQTANQVVAFYRNSNGQTVTVAYQSLPPTGAATTQAPAQVAPTQAPAVVVTAPQPQTTVVYETAPRVVYYEDPYYYPRYYYPPVSLHLGFGYSRYYGGYRHWHR